MEEIERIERIKLLAFLRDFYGDGPDMNEGCDVEQLYSTKSTEEVFMFMAGNPIAAATLSVMSNQRA